MQNLFPGGIRLPSDTNAAIQYMREHYGSDGADGLRRSINQFRAWQKIYRDCGWGLRTFDGEAFEVKRANLIESLEELDNLEMKARHPPGFAAGSQQSVGGDTHTLDQVLSRLDEFLVKVAGEYAV
jgi:hypothetical protein